MAKELLKKKKGIAVLKFAAGVIITFKLFMGPYLQPFQLVYNIHSDIHMVRKLSYNLHFD